MGEQEATTRSRHPRLDVERSCHDNYLPSDLRVPVIASIKCHRLLRDRASISGVSTNREQHIAASLLPSFTRSGTRVCTGSWKIGRGYFHDKKHGFGGSSCEDTTRICMGSKKGVIDDDGPRSGYSFEGLELPYPRAQVVDQFVERRMKGLWKWRNLKLRRSWNFFFFFFFLLEDTFDWY